MLQVRHSQQANEPLLSPWINTDKDGMVLCCHCDCMAGLGEVCSHVGALLFYVEAMRHTYTCTDLPCPWNIPPSIDSIKIHSSVSAAKKTKKDVWHTSVLFAGTAKLPNSAFCISKTTKPISTKFTYFLLFIYTTLHSKFEGNRFSSS